MPGKTIIEVESLSKKFMIGKKASDLRYALRDMFSFTKEKKQEIWALKDISFSINEGEVFGIIGPNGSGKSTLLKILSKITYPTSGRAILRGKVSSLLEVGTGFHPELTGRENIYLNGSILGMKRAEINKKFDEIVDFSGVEQFIDTPVKHYSSGMYVRLAFSVAAHLEPDILLVDEVLSVGDMAFRQKSIKKMNEVAKSGRTVVFVSHNLGIIKEICNKGIYIDKGKIIDSGNINKVVDKYYKSFLNDIDLQNINNENKYIKVNKIEIINNSVPSIQTVNCGDNISVKILYELKQDISQLMVKLIIKNLNNQYLFSCNNSFTGDLFYNPGSKGIIECNIPKLNLNSGNYTVDLYFNDSGKEIYVARDILKFEVFAGKFYDTGIMPYKSRLFLVEQEWDINPK